VYGDKNPRKNIKKVICGMKTHENWKISTLAGFFVVAAFASDACRRSGSVYS
jgi:hypothetical protein